MTQVSGRSTAGYRFRHLALGGLVAGTLDLIYICSLWAAMGVGPLRILHSIAAGWLGRESAIAGGAATALLGLVSHYAIAFAMACLYGLASRRWPPLVRHPLRYGALYGVALYLSMNFVVVPLSAAGIGPPRWEWMQVSHLLAHMLLVGIPCALAARRAAHIDPAPYPAAAAPIRATGESDA
ncbi:hypothetical protein H0E84_09775 [Luteimonas sp. SJ-92]|uniref:DUF1440 domain-containing protein n=1 Tax=Luteimonas salinisoli TaxID=2752307 RepID=A0A853JD46_9GAMM|nr:hypothetical protein [Luteimonas salinisoli]NZA26674.1 hypothetical protein [Luteimonas salinisoli]